MNASGRATVAINGLFEFRRGKRGGHAPDRHESESESFHFSPSINAMRLR
ncbi:hypothetical protein SDC9_113817 [bioreactor metagenome]|uniref:Uncharacterized protein n=1 Tax=bioreactor metagenome TaxID=1076179 RepID=A0A645BYW9_9ZZZZ